MSARVVATAIEPVTNGAARLIENDEPYGVRVTIQGTSDILFHRWNDESVAQKSKAAKGSKSSKMDDLESYVYRDDDGKICIPTMYLRAAIIMAGKNEKDPRSPRKSMVDLLKASVLPASDLVSLGVDRWDYEHQSRVKIQMAAITRIRPALKKGWSGTFEFTVMEPEYVGPDLFHRLVTQAGRLVGIGDFRPTYGRFHITHFERVKLSD